MSQHKHRVCPWRTAYLFDNPIRRLIHDPAKILGSYIKPGMTVVDVGCGMGFFSLGMARLVGPKGRVISLDIQPQMLNVLKGRARRRRLLDRIETRLIEPDGLGIDETVDFILAFWMVHEVPDQEIFFQDVSNALNVGSHLYVCEPKPHVTEDELESSVGIAEGKGFKVIERPPIRMGTAVVLEKGGV